MVERRVEMKIGFPTDPGPADDEPEDGIQEIVPKGAGDTGEIRITTQRGVDIILNSVDASLIHNTVEAMYVRTRPTDPEPEQGVLEGRRWETAMQTLCNVMGEDMVFQMTDGEYSAALEIAEEASSATIDSLLDIPGVAEAVTNHMMRTHFPTNALVHEYDLEDPDLMSFAYFYCMFWFNSHPVEDEAGDEHK
jgi:hypothetical protein